MRIACRRLQTVLIVFAEYIEKGALRKFKKQLRRLIRRLGAVRQSDVLIEIFSARINTADDKQQTVKDLLLARYLTHRKEAVQKLVKLLTEIEAGKVFEGFYSAVIVSPANSNKKTVREIDAVFFGHVMPEALGNLVREFSLGAAQAMEHGDSGDVLHEMRIAGKPLRYALELSEGCFNGGFDEYFQDVKKMIQWLGDVHDIDEAIAALSSFRKEMQSYNDAAGAVIEHFPFEFLLEADKELMDARKKLCGKVNKNLRQWRLEKFFKKFLALLAKAS
jgi:CHAD domain-containing protein